MNSPLENRKHARTALEDPKRSPYNVYRSDILPTENPFVVHMWDLSKYGAEEED